jgi:uncharacterized protein (TIGR02996 family)
MTRSPTPPSAFLTLAADPADRRARSALVDWLEAQGQHDRAELVRTELRLEGLPDDDPDEKRLYRRRSELLARLKKDLQQSLPRGYSPYFEFEAGLLMFRSGRALLDNLALADWWAAQRRWVRELQLWDGCDDAVLRGLVERGMLDGVPALDFSCAVVTDAGAAALAGLKHLRRLSLYNCKGISDRGVAALAGLTRLRALNLGLTSAGDRGVKALAVLSRLRELDVQFTAVTDAGAAALRNFPQLRSVQLNHTKVADWGLKGLVGLRHLRQVNLQHTRVTDQGAQLLAGLERLENLDLSETKVTDRGLAALTGLERLQSLRLWRCARVTNKGAESLARMKRLEALEVLGTRMTWEGTLVVQQALPGCQVKEN